MLSSRQRRDELPNFLIKVTGRAVLFELQVEHLDQIPVRQQQDELAGLPERALRGPIAAGVWSLS